MQSLCVLVCMLECQSCHDDTFCNSSHTKWRHEIGGHAHMCMQLAWHQPCQDLSIHIHQGDLTLIPLIHIAHAHMNHTHIDQGELIHISHIHIHQGVLIHKEEWDPGTQRCAHPQRGHTNEIQIHKGVLIHKEAIPMRCRYTKVFSSTYISSPAIKPSVKWI